MWKLEMAEAVRAVLLIAMLGLFVDAEVVNDNTITTANLSRPARCLGCYDDRGRLARFFDFDWLRRSNYYDRNSNWYRPDARYDDYYRSRVDSGYYGDRYYGRSNYYDYNYRGNGYDNLSPSYDQYRDFGYNNYYRSMPDNNRYGYDSRYYRPYDETYRGSSGFDIQTGKGHYFAQPPIGTHQSPRPSDSQRQFGSHQNLHSHSSNPLSDSYQNHPIPFEDPESYSSEHHNDQYSSEGDNHDAKPNDHIHIQQLPDVHIANRFNSDPESHPIITNHKDDVGDSHEKKS